MSRAAFRDLSDLEVNIIHRLIPAGFMHAQTLIEQLSTAQVLETDLNGSLKFKVESDKFIDCIDGPFLEGIQSDKNSIPNYGPFINYILFIKKGQITELQIYKDDGGTIETELNPSAISLEFSSNNRASVRDRS